MKYFYVILLFINLIFISCIKKNDIKNYQQTIENTINYNNIIGLWYLKLDFNCSLYYEFKFDNTYISSIICNHLNKPSILDAEQIIGKYTINNNKIFFISTEQSCNNDINSFLTITAINNNELSSFEFAVNFKKLTLLQKEEFINNIQNNIRIGCFDEGDVSLFKIIK